jgi:hypothetical protein
MNRTDECEQYFSIRINRIDKQIKEIKKKKKIKKDYVELYYIL